MSASELANKVWNYAHVLRALQNRFAFSLESLRASLGTSKRSLVAKVFPTLRSGYDGVGYGDYVEAALARPCASRHLCIHAHRKSPINEVPHECV